MPFVVGMEIETEKESEMITSDEAEKLAQEAMQKFVNQCECDNPQDVGNALMKLVSMCGLGMCATVGHDESVARLQATTNYIAKAQKGVNYRIERAN